LDSPYPQIFAKLNPVIVGTPKVETYDATATTVDLFLRLKEFSSRGRQ
jgi:hypothetical protein